MYYSSPPYSIQCVPVSTVSQFTWDPEHSLSNLSRQSKINPLLSWTLVIWPHHAPSFSTSNSEYNYCHPMIHHLPTCIQSMVLWFQTWKHISNAFIQIYLYTNHCSPNHCQLLSQYSSGPLTYLHSSIFLPLLSILYMANNLFFK